MTPIIRVENLSKQYRIGSRNTSYATLRDSMSDAVSNPLRRLKRLTNGNRGNPQSASRDSQSNLIWALKDVSFDVMPGEVVGIIGRNGAGKSTLLKILSRITEPTRGGVDLHGRVGSLLEVGTGFHPELTGRDNVYLNGAILGMKKAEIDSKFDEIVSFAEIEKFIDTPVKHYSSGMYVRLAFAVAAHFEPEILLVDEVLAVGDFAFQSKCLGRMQFLGENGRTVILVSHNMAVISNLCRRAILLQDGRVHSIGVSERIIEQYIQRGKVGAEWSRDSTRVTAEGIAITRVRLFDSEGASAEEFLSDVACNIEITYEVRGLKIQSRIVLEVETEEGLVVFATTDCDLNGGVDVDRTPGRYTTWCKLPPNFLAPGKYYVTAAASCTRRVEWDRISRAVAFRVSRIGSLYIIDDRPGVIAPILAWDQRNLGEARK